MTIIPNVHGTQEKVLPLELNVDTVYLRKNIVRLKDAEDREYWQYDETQMSLIEYFRQVIPQSEDAIGELALLFAAYQTQMDQALAELSIAIGGQDNV